MSDDWEKKYPDDSWEDSWEEEPYDDWGDIDNCCILMNQLNLNHKIDDIEIINGNKLIIIRADMYKEFFKIYENLNLKTFEIWIMLDEMIKIIDIKIKSKDKDLTTTDSLILCKLEKILKNTKIDLTKEFVPLLIKKITRYLTNDIYDFCYICGKRGIMSKNDGLNILVLNLCGDLLCITNSFISDGVIFQEELSKNMERFKLMLYLFIYSCKVNRIPCILPENIDLKNVLKLLENLPKFDEIKYMECELDNSLYSLMSWLIFTYKDKIILESETSSELIFEIRESDNIKSEIFKNADKSKILNRYHGSADFNYFNIMMNGLQSFSRTKYQTNGAAYGKGVYFGSKNTAIGYNRKIPIKDDSITEILNSYKYNKTSKILNCDIYYEDSKWVNTNFCTVIPKSENIIIKKLIIKKN